MITSHICGDLWKRNPYTEIIDIENADMSDWSVKGAFKKLVDMGCDNVHVVMEDSQSPEGSSTRFTHGYTYNHNGDVIRHVYDDSAAKHHESMYGDDYQDCA